MITATDTSTAAAAAAPSAIIRVSEPDDDSALGALLGSLLGTSLGAGDGAPLGSVLGAGDGADVAGVHGTPTAKESQLICAVLAKFAINPSNVSSHSLLIAALCH